MKEVILNLIIAILKEFNVSYGSWEEFKDEIDYRYSLKLKKTTIKKD